MIEKTLSVEACVYLSRYQEEIDRSLSLQVQLNEMAQERDHYKSELNKMIEENSKNEFKEPTQKGE